MKEFMKNIFTSKDNVSYSLSKLLSISGGAAMVFNFVKTGSIDFQGFGTGISLLIAALAAKYYVEGKA